MNDNAPKISVIIPAYNAAAFLSEALDSVLAQTFEGWVCTVVDDGSTDATYAIAESYCNKDARFSVARRANGGSAKARNEAMKLSPADYYAFLDADDMWLAGKLEEQLAAIKNLEVDLVFSSCFWLRDESLSPHDASGCAWNKVLDSKVFLNELKKGCFFVPSGTLISARAKKKAGWFDEDLIAAQDWDFWIRLATSGCSAFGLAKPLYLRRLHAKNMINNLELEFWCTLKIMEKHLASYEGPTAFRQFSRTIFRNTFTVLGDRYSFLRDEDSWSELCRMFDTYRPFDRDGLACRAMAVLRITLPAKLFWLLSRYAIIPLAWHLERLKEVIYLSLSKRRRYE